MPALQTLMDSIALLDMLCAFASVAQVAIGRGARVEAGVAGGAGDRQGQGQAGAGGGAGAGAGKGGGRGRGP